MYAFVLKNKSKVQSWQELAVLGEKKGILSVILSVSLINTVAFLIFYSFFG